MTTGGNLVFQGQIDSKFNAYAADTGRLLWSYDAGAAVIAPPISYSVAGRQYVTVLSGNDTSGAAFGVLYQQYGIDYRTQKRRVLTFTLDGTAVLPPTPPPAKFEPIADADYRGDALSAKRGEKIYALYCAVCHGVVVVAGGHAPDLRSSPVPLTEESFSSIVRDGALMPNGMPRFEELTDGERSGLRQYIRSQAHAAMKAD
jgi:quinohemoprotein ethanol dehydrogenase